MHISIARFYKKIKTFLRKLIDRNAFLKKASLLFQNEKESLVKVFKKTLLFFSVFVVFNIKLIDLFKEWLVNPFLSTVTSNWLADLFCIGIVTYLVRFFVRSAVKDMRIPNAYSAGILSFIGLYCYYRFFDKEVFEFERLSISGEVFCLLDGSVVVGGSVLFYWVYRCYKQPVATEFSTREGFFVEEPICVNASNDLFRRWTFAKEFLNLLLKTNNATSSFAVGIIGEWGSGKTSLIKGIEQIVESNDGCLYVEFNPWLTHSSKSISEAFFSTLAAVLADYDVTLEDKILDYSSKLIDAVDDKKAGFLMSVLGIEKQAIDIKEQFVVLNAAMGRLNKKIVVSIDDLDRLYPAEVNEVLKLVRNTASFGNFYFLIAYDREYILQCIESFAKGRSANYLDKIIQLEYYLPFNNDKTVLDGFFYKKLQEVLTDNDLMVIREMSIDPIWHEFIPNVNYYLKTVRDIYRLLNIFVLNYDYVKNNVYLPDYIFISIVKLKYPEVYRLLYYCRVDFLGDISEQNVPFDESNLSLRRVKKNGGVETTELYIYLLKEKGKYAFDQQQVTEACEMLETLFNNEDERNLYDGDRRSYFNNHLTITKGLYFDRYFDAFLGNSIREEDVVNCLVLSKAEREKKLSVWLANHYILNDLRTKVASLWFKAVDNREHYENLIMLIFGIGSKVGFKVETALYRMGANRESDMDGLVSRFYAGSVDEFKEFYENVFYEYCSYDDWEFVQVVIKELLARKDIWVLNRSELLAAFLWRFERRLLAHLRFISDILHQFELGFLDGGKLVISEGGIVYMGVDMFKQFLERIENVSDFLNCAIIREHRTYKFKAWLEGVYGEWEGFEGYLFRCMQRGVLVEEYYNFFILLRQNEFEFIEYSFLDNIIDPNVEFTL